MNPAPLLLVLAFLLFPIPAYSQIPAHPITDPVRIINGERVSVQRGGAWCTIIGQVAAVATDGIILHGILPSNSGPPTFDEVDFFIANFPYRVAEGDLVGLGWDICARKAGTYTYITAIGGSRTIHRFDYGHLPGPPAPPRQPTPEELAAAQKKKAAEALARFQSHHARAAAGNEFSQRYLAELYTKGLGCQKDTNAAAAWLRAAATNHPAR